MISALSMKGHRGEAVKLSHGKGGSPSGNREPLFPRLHVNETEKAGPKAPPRNKMALYEQFTVPSHRFLQPTQASTPAAFQQLYGSGYPYIPYYIPSVSYTTNNNVQSYSQPSQVTSSSGITTGSMVLNEEFQKAPRLPKVGNSSPCKVSRGLTETSANCLKDDVVEHRGKGDKSFCGSMVPNHIGENIPAGKETRHLPHRTENIQEAPSTLEQGAKAMHQRSHNPRVDNTADSERSRLLSCDAPAGVQAAETLTKATKKGTLEKSPMAGPKYKRDSVSPALANLEKCAVLSGTAEPRISGETVACLVAEDQSLLSMDGEDHGSALAFNLSSRNSMGNPPQGSVPDLKEEGFCNGVVPGKSEIESFENLKANEDKEREVSQPACTEGLADFAADLEPLFRPKDVILAIGQQQFWKARKTLLRQQRIFSDQVFQLHKLITIQHLLAETPGTLIDDAAHFETVGGSDVAAKKIIVSDCALNARVSKKRSRSHSVDAEPPPAVSKDVKKEVHASMPEFPHGGVSAWGYPSFGHWIGPLAPQGQPYPYQPLAGTLPPGSAFGFPYGSALPESAGPMVSFGIPYCGQRQELSAEMGSNYGPATVSKHDGIGFTSRNFSHFSNDLAASWYTMQHNNLSNRRLQSGKDAPTGSGASVNKVPGTAVQHVKTSCFPGLTYQLGLNNQVGTEGLEISTQQSEISSPSVDARLNCIVTPLKSSAPAAKKPELTPDKEAEGVAQRSLDKEDMDPRPYLMTQRDGGDNMPLDGDELLVASVQSSDLASCALELFPLVPSLSSRDRNWERDPRAVDGGQGHVIRVVPRRAIAASESAAGILLSLQREREK